MKPRLFSFSFIVLVVSLLSLVSGQVSAAKNSGERQPNFRTESNSTTEVEGSANGLSTLADVETNGSGYPTDDEDGDDVHGSGNPPQQPKSPVTTKTTKTTPPTVITTAVTVKPVTETVPTTKPTMKEVHKPKENPAKEVKVDDDDDEDDDEDEDYEDEDDEDFADENIHNDDMFGVTTTTTPFIVTTTPTRKTFATNPPRIHETPTTTVSSGPFSPFHETMTNGFYAAIAGGVLVAVITAILLVLFVVFRIRKKDEGSYALDEPKQTRPYSTYTYTKASTKEFYA